jgi:hypothetical protein
MGTTLGLGTQCILQPTERLQKTLVGLLTHRFLYVFF